MSFIFKFSCFCGCRFGCEKKKTKKSPAKVTEKRSARLRRGFGEVSARFRRGFSDVSVTFQRGFGEVRRPAHTPNFKMFAAAAAAAGGPSRAVPRPKRSRRSRAAPGACRGGGGRKNFQSRTCYLRFYLRFYV